MPAQRTKCRAASGKKPGSVPRKIRVRYISLNCRMPAVSVADLALMLEIDLMLNRREDYIKRLQRALNAAASFSGKNPRRH
ncbi:MAG: hypothetical protein PHY92_04855 [Alphaproteobacteria bacterium]|nr:hypothetical protein [Alphaproteobacteria bacterium]